MTANLVVGTREGRWDLSHDGARGWGDRQVTLTQHKNSDTPCCVGEVVGHRRLRREEIEKVGYQVLSCLMVSTDVIKPHDQEQLGEGRVYFNPYRL